MTYLQGTACAGLLGVLAMAGWMQAPVSNQRTAVCQFEDGGQVSVRYEAAPAQRDRLLEGRVWSPGGSPMYLFTSTPLKAGETEIPIGAYSLYVIPEKQQWTLVVNKDVTGKKYDTLQDLLRIPMDLGTLDQVTQNINVMFGHIAPKKCSLRLYYRRTGAWTVLSEP